MQLFEMWICVWTSILNSKHIHRLYLSLRIPYPTSGSTLMCSQKNQIWDPKKQQNLTRHEELKQYGNKKCFLIPEIRKIFNLAAMLDQETNIAVLQWANLFRYFILHYQLKSISLLFMVKYEIWGSNQCQKNLVKLFEINDTKKFSYCAPFFKPSWF